MILLFAMLLTIILIFNLVFFIKDIRHPSNLYLSSWIVSLFFMSFGFVNYIHIDILTLFYIIAATMIFCSFAYLGGASFRNSSALIRREISGENKAISNLATFLGYLGLISALYYYQSRFGLINLITNPGFVRSTDDGGSGVLGFLIFLPPTSFILLVILHFLKYRFSFLQYILVFLIFAYMLILPERTTLVNSLVWSLAAIYSITRGTQTLSFALLRKYAAPFMLVIVVILSFFIFVSSRTQKVQYVNNIDYAISDRFSIPIQLIDPYIYLTGSLPAFNIVLQDNFSRGSAIKMQPDKTVLVITRLIQILKSESKGDLSANAIFINIPFPFNTYTWLREPILDYGYLGALLYISVCGYLVGLAWKAAKANFNIFSCFFYGWAASATIFTILTNKFSSTFYTYAFGEVVVFYIIAKFIQAYSINSASMRGRFR